MACVDFGREGNASTWQAIYPGPEFAACALSGGERRTRYSMASKSSAISSRVVAQRSRVSGVTKSKCSTRLSQTFLTSRRPSAKTLNHPFAVDQVVPLLGNLLVALGRFVHLDAVGFI